MGPASLWLPSAPTQTDLRGDLDLALGVKLRPPCGCAASTCDPIAGFARVSLGNSSCVNEGLLAGFTTNSLRSSWLPVSDGPT
eukprot:15557833-Heterocapsa_arctica.AAC.1